MAFVAASVVLTSILAAGLPGITPNVQTATAGLAGTVVRGVDAPIEGAKVSVTRLNGDDIDKTFQEREIQTDQEGRFAFRDLEPGRYMLTVSVRFANEASLVCKPSGPLSLNRNSWFMAIARTADGGFVQVVTSDGLEIAGAKTRSETVDMRCKGAS